ncbi:MAG: aminomethyltransferase family protein [Acidobacteriia bacterium]|nr:aminomethyltransferase family protein [Terriglobia bacterium]
MDTPLIQEHRAAGARLAEFQGCVLPEVFSDFEKEYHAARHSVALFDTSWHAVLVLTGRDRVKYLHAITSNNIQALSEGSGALALLLNPQGHILAELEIYLQPEKVLVRTHVSARERAVAMLEKYIIASDVKIADATETTGSLALEGPRAAAIIQQACGLAIEDLPEMSIRDVAIEHIRCQVLRRSHFGTTGVEIVARRDWLPSLWQKLLGGIRAHGGEPIGMAALNALRLEAGVPWFPVDFNDSMIPHEAVLENTHISFSKGCYTGQEIVERVRSRGQVNRKRVSLKFSSAAPPLPGTKLRADGADVGYVTSSAFSPAEGRAIGMAYLRREHFTPGSAVEFEGGTAVVLPQAGS